MRTRTWASQSVYFAEEGLPELGEVVAAVGLQGAHGLLEVRAQQDEVRGALADERLLLVELPRGGAARHQAVLKLPGSRELAVGAGQEDRLKAVVKPAAAAASPGRSSSL